MGESPISKIEQVSVLAEDMSEPEAKMSMEVLSDSLSPNEKLNMAKMLTIEAFEEKALEAKNKRAKKGLAPKLKLSVDFGKTAYEKQLDSACTPYDSLAHAASVHQLPIEGVMGVKHDKWPYNGKVVELLSDKFTHENDMVLEIRKTSASLAGHSTTINAGLNVISALQKLEARVDFIHQKMLYQEQITQEERLKNEKLKEVVIDHELRVEAMEEKMSMDQMTPQQKAERLEKRGLKRTDIAKFLGVERNTIARWLGKKNSP